MQLTISNQGVRFTSAPKGVVSIDVFFDDTRVWSVDLQVLEPGNTEPTSLEWPEPLLPYLHGDSTITLRDSSSGAVLASTAHAFGGSDTRVSVADERGNKLAINKWGRLGKTLDGVDDTFRDRITARTQQLIQELTGFGLRPFVVGGTLLGGIREGDLLAHDDDADLAYLSQHTNPAEVAIEGFQVGHKLSSLGHHVVRHSATHMQLYFFAPDGAVDHYVDVFAAFFTEDGNINQPFHVRGEFSKEQMLPFSTVQIRGVDFPAPREPEDWLVINYDDNWRMPIPGYRLDTPRSTRRRFQSWFGSFHFHRDFWNDYSSPQETSAWNAGAEWLRREHAKSPSQTIVDLGTGDGRTAECLARDRADRRVLGLDYSLASQQLASSIKQPNFEWGHLNLYRLDSIAVVQSFRIEEAFDVSLNHVLEQVGHQARANALRIIRTSLRSGGSALATFYTRPAEIVRRQDPTGWHLELSALKAEASKLGLEFTSIKIAPDSASAARRRPVGVRFSLANLQQESSVERTPMKSRIIAFFKKAFTRPDVAEVNELKERLAALERDLDGYRSDSLRVAELVDLAERLYGSPRDTNSAETSEKK